MPREICEGCSRPKSVCLCEHFVQITAPIQIVILQHPDEQKHPLATVPILEACLENVDVRIGEQFSMDDFAHIDLSKAGLLFPHEDADVWQAGENDKAAAIEGAIQTLFVIDGTWRKAKRIHFETPWLQSLPHIMLSSTLPTEYRIRSSKVEGGLSTLETVVQACNYLSQGEQYNVLLKPFRAMVDMQIKKMGAETFNAHYKGQTDVSPQGD